MLKNNFEIHLKPMFFYKHQQWCWSVTYLFLFICICFLPIWLLLWPTHRLKYVCCIWLCLWLVLTFICKWHSRSLHSALSQMSRWCVCHSTTSEFMWRWAMPSLSNSRTGSTAQIYYRNGRNEIAWMSSRKNVSWEFCW